ncbi:MAG: hypothetical protein KGZ58_03270 [Ignavibacteriales bacterium]|nr:hypothetical protein [Ignavibacteriales bacterium]
MEQQILQTKTNFYNASINRFDVYAVQEKDGSYHPSNHSLTLENYLRGKETIGTYPIDPTNNTVRFFCIDIDVKKSAMKSTDYVVDSFLPILQQQAQQIQAVFDKHGIGLLYTEFSGSKGYHLWGLLSEPVAAKQVRAKLHELEKEFLLVSDSLA